MNHSLPLAILVCATLASAQWSTPVVQASASSASSDFDPCVSFDGLKLYFTSQRTVNFELFVATRTAPYTQFGAATQILELADPGTDAGPCVRADDCEILWYSSRAGGLGSTDIWRATRATPALPWGAPSNVTELNSASGENSPSLTADGLRVYYTRTSVVYTASRPNLASPFSTPVPVPELTSSAEREPHISPDGLAIFFTSSRAGGAGGSDTWMATRLTPTATFSNIQNLTLLNSSAADVSPSIATFADEIFFCSFRTGGPGSYDIYSSRFTGLVGNGIAGINSTRSLRFSDPSSPGLVYVAAAALGDTPGITFGNGTLPLNPDVLFLNSIGGIPPVLTGYTGPLDANGIAAGAINFQGYPFLLGFRFFSAFLVIDPTNPFLFKTYSNSHEVLVQ